MQLGLDFRLERDRFRGREAIATILRRAIVDRERGLGGPDIEVSDDAVGAIARFANGDARAALNLLEFAAATAPMSPETRIPPVDGKRRRIASSTSTASSSPGRR